MKHALLLLMAISLSSCSTRKAYERKFPPVIISDVRTSTMIQIRDTTLKVKIAGDTVNANFYLVQPKEPHFGINSHQMNFPSIQDTTSILHTAFSTSVVKIENGCIQHSLQQPDTLVDVRVEGAVRTISKKEKLNTTALKESPVKSTFIETVIWPVLQLALTLVILLLTFKAFAK